MHEHVDLNTRIRNANRGQLDRVLIKSKHELMSFPIQQSGCLNNAVV